LNGSLRLGSLFGITIRVHVLLLVLIGLLLAHAEDLFMAATQVGFLFAIVLLHELGHSVVAQSFGIRVVDITLWPLGGMARMSEIPESPKIEGLIAVAGPIVNFVLAAIAALVLGAQSLSGGTGSRLPELATSMLQINLMMGVFNLIPAFPMDGGRVLRAFLGRSGDWVSATTAAVRVGRMFAGLIALCGIAAVLLVPGFGAQGLIFLLIAAFVWLTGAQELVTVKARHGVVDLGGWIDLAQRAADWSSRSGGAGGAPGAHGSGAADGATHADARPQAQDEAHGSRGFGADEIERLEKFRGPLRGYRVDEG
jgi:Zn-dependent protease